jgi:nucleotide-binding universal stress UspA family protein
MPKILLATDFSDGSAAAERTAVALARKLGATVTAFHVLEPPAYSAPNLTFYVPAPEMLREAQRATQETLRKTEERIRAEGVTVDSQFIEGVPASEIVRAADEGNYDLVVIGTHGRTGLQRLVLGSVAERVVRLCPRAVLTVRSDGPELSAAIT